jgi:hypothetical protein
MSSATHYPSDAEMRRRQGRTLDRLLNALPEKRAELEEAGRLRATRRAVRSVLDVRGLVLGADDDARIDACTDLDTLRRWLKQAVVVASVAEALR